MDPLHRKIELQSPADLTHLTTQLRTLARQKLDLHLPPQPGTDASSPDDLRAQTEALVDAFVANILQGMRHNISINGVDVIPRGAADENGDVAAGVGIGGVGEAQENAVIEEFEPFDEKLRKKVGAMVERRDKLVEGISRHRRETGMEAAKKWEGEWVKVDQDIEKARVAGLEGAAVKEEDGGLDKVGLKRQGDVEVSWGRAVEGLGRLNGGLPETRARLERAGEVVGYLGASGKEA